MKPHSLFLGMLACCWALGAQAQWQWLDSDGRKVFSDRPPPQDVPAQRILRQPRGIALPTTAPSQEPAAAAAPAVPSGKDAQLEANKDKAEAAEAAKKKAEEAAAAQRQAKLRAQNCASARQAKSTLESGGLLSHVNAQGERGFMDDATRSQQLRNAQQAIDANCGK